MASSIFGKSQQRSNGSIIQQFAHFKKQMQGKDAGAVIKQLMAEGKMTQQQFEELKQEAQSLMAILH